MSHPPSDCHVADASTHRFPSGYSDVTSRPSVAFGPVPTRTYRPEKSEVIPRPFMPAQAASSASRGVAKLDPLAQGMWPVPTCWPEAHAGSLTARGSPSTDTGGSGDLVAMTTPTIAIPEPIASRSAFLA